MKIVKGKKKDIDEILALLRDCVRDMVANGIYQWNEMYPLPRMFEEDLEKGILFAMKEEDKIIGIIVLTNEPEDEYKKIKWIDDSGNSLIIHRMMVHPEWQRKGIAGKLLDFAEDYARKNKYSSIHLDTYSGNPRSQRLFEKRKYDKKRGHVHFRECPDPFYCFEVRISEK